MIHKQIQTKVKNATVKILKPGALGILVIDNLIITAAHCINCRFDGSMAIGSTPLDFIVDIESAQGEKFQVEPLAVEPVSDIAILQPLQHDDLSEEHERYIEFCERTEPIPVSLSDFKFRESSPIYIYTHKGTWIQGKASTGFHWGPFLAIEPREPIENGTSGGPIVNEAGELVGIVSSSLNFPRPHLALPFWIYRKHFKQELGISEEDQKQFDTAVVNAKITDNKVNEFQVDPERIAYHEAGHAVMAYLLGKRMKKVSVIANDDSLGRAEVSPIRLYGEYELELTDEWDYNLRKRVDREVMVGLAGQIAELQHMSNKYHDYYIGDDTDSVAYLAKFNGSMKQIGAYYDWLYTRTEDKILDIRHWCAVEAIAQELLVKREIKGQEAQRIIVEAIKDWIHKRLGRMGG